MENSSKTQFKCEEPDIFKEAIKAQKKFIIKMNNNKYRLTIIKYDNRIQLKINDINNLNLYYYQNKYTLKNIIDSFKLDIDLYDSFDKIMDLIKDAYLNNNIFLKLFNNNINLIIRYNNYESIFTLNKYDFEINEKFDIIIKEINNIRKNKNILLIGNKLEQLEKLLTDLKKFTYSALTKNWESIKSLKTEISKNLFILNDNKKTIQLLNIELINLNKKFEEFKEKVKKWQNSNFKKENKEEKKNYLYLKRMIKINKYKRVQIALFATTFKERKPCVIINNFLKNHSHLLFEQKNNKIGFLSQFRDSDYSLKINIYSISNFDAEYIGIDNVSCYLLLIDLDNNKIKEQYELILRYINDYCDIKKKLFVLGMYNKNGRNKYFYEQEISGQLIDFKFHFEYIHVNKFNEEQISNTIMNILLYCSEHPILSDDEIQEKIIIKNNSKEDNIQNNILNDQENKSQNESLINRTQLQSHNKEECFIM